MGVPGAAGWRLRASLPEGLASLGVARTGAAIFRGATVERGALLSDSESEDGTMKGSNKFDLLVLAKGMSSACEVG